MRDQGGGLVIGTEIETEKARHARNHFAEAGVADLIQLREGDALVTLKDCGGPVDLLLVDGFPKLARSIIELMVPQLRKGAIVVSDNVGHFRRSLADYLDIAAPGQRLCFDSPAVEERNRALCENLIEACSDPLRAADFCTSCVALSRLTTPSPESTRSALDRFEFTYSVHGCGSRQDGASR